VLHLRFRHALARLAPAAVAVLAATCTSPTKPGPVVEPIIQSVSPSAGPATGGTQVTIRGANFAAGTAVTVGGRPATSVNVSGSDVITAMTPASTTAGAADISVTTNGRTGTLPGGFKYEVTTNTPPTIKSIVARGKRPGEPANFADYGETIVVTAVVEDAETNPAQLQYQWLACGGTFTGTGAQVEWRAPTGGPGTTICSIELVLSDGAQVVTGSVTVRVHDSVVEIRNLVLEFLTEFADSTIPAEQTVRNFSSSCPGKAAELRDVANNRATRIINSHNYGTPAVTVAFGSVCRGRPSDACAITSAEWQSTVKPTGPQEAAKGISTITGVYRDARWWLCDSLFDGTSSLGLHFMH